MTNYNSPIHKKFAVPVWEIKNNWCQYNILIFAVINSKYDSKIQLMAPISKNSGNKFFEICAIDKHKYKNKYTNYYFKNLVNHILKSISDSSVTKI